MHSKALECMLVEYTCSYGKDPKSQDNKLLILSILANLELLDNYEEECRRHKTF